MTGTWFTVQEQVAITSASLERINSDVDGLVDELLTAPRGEDVGDLIESLSGIVSEAASLVRGLQRAVAAAAFRAAPS